MYKMEMLILTNAATPTNPVQHWNITSVREAEEAVEKIQHIEFDLIAIGQDTNAHAKAMIEKLAHFQQPDASIIVYQSLTEVILKANALWQSFKTSTKTRLNISDNAFKNHPLYHNDSSIV